MVAEVEVLEFNNKINKEVKMFLVVLSSDIKASWNWCQKPQALKKNNKKMQGLNRDSYFKPSWKWESEFYTASLMFSWKCNSKKTPTCMRTASFSGLTSQTHAQQCDWGERECFPPYIWEKGHYAKRQARCFHNKRWETAPGSCYRCRR